MRDHAAADEFVRQHLDLPFDWRKNNCCNFCSGYVKALTGLDHLGMEADVQDVRAALRAVRGYGDLTAAVTAKLGEPVDAAFAQRGDVVLIPNTEGVGDSIGICTGASLVAPGETGLVFQPMSQATLAWRTPVAPAT